MLKFVVMGNAYEKQNLTLGTNMVHTRMVCMRSLAKYETRDPFSGSKKISGKDRIRYGYVLVLVQYCSMLAQVCYSGIFQILISLYFT